VKYIATDAGATIMPANGAEVGGPVRARRRMPRMRRGDSLNKEALHYRIWDKNIAELCRMDRERARRLDVSEVTESHLD
jgi:hypothetical protein